MVAKITDLEREELQLHLKNQLKVLKTFWAELDTRLEPVIPLWTEAIIVYCTTLIQLNHHTTLLLLEPQIRHNRVWFLIGETYKNNTHVQLSSKTMRTLKSRWWQSSLRILIRQCKVVWLLAIIFYTKMISRIVPCSLSIKRVGSSTKVAPSTA